jgi:AraC-like DNA-binding protein
MDRHSPAMQSAAALTNLRPLLSELGTDLDAVLAGTGVTAEMIDPTRMIPYAATLAILENAARLTRCEDFGLRLGRRHDLATLGPLGALMRGAPTLGEALADFAAFQINNSTGASVYLHRSGDEVIWGYGIYDSRGVTSSVVHDLAIAAGRALMAELTQGMARPLEFCSTRPAPTNPAPWRALGAPFRFGQGETGIFLAKSDLAIPLPTVDHAGRNAMLAALASRTARAKWNWAERVRHELRPLLIEGRSGMDDMAARLGLHPRTLRRALAREATTFEAIRDQVRDTAARELLALTTRPMGDLAMTLDFASPNAFIRAFRRWNGCSPAAWRARRREAAE